MRAVVARAAGAPPRVEDVQVEGPRAGEVLVRIAASGVCGSDLHVLRGRSPVARYPCVLGHEGAGVVADVGAGVGSVRTGDHVVVALYGPCLACRHCLAGDPARCDGPARMRAIGGEMADGSTRLSAGGAPLYPFVGSGSLAEQVVVRESQLVRVGPDVPLDVICLAGCGVTTGLGAVFTVARVAVGDSVAVIGCGGVGLSVIQGARISGAGRIVAVDINPAKLGLAERLGATDVLSPAAGADVTAALAEVLPGGVDVAFEVVGDPALVAAALAATRPGGTCVMVGSPPPGSTIPVDARVLFQDRRLLGCVGGGNVPARDIPRVVELYRSGALALDELVSSRFTLDEVADAVAALSAGEVARAVVVVDGAGRGTP
jgi:S-(hydroxymethyl)glutathione dehydrogenase / alcohol dehydrogenase